MKEQFLNPGSERSSELGILFIAGAYFSYNINLNPTDQYRICWYKMPTVLLLIGFLKKFVILFMKYLEKHPQFVSICTEASLIPLPQKRN